jgi:hypothetical protein
VWCQDCFSFVTIEELAGQDNGHRIGFGSFSEHRRPALTRKDA